MQKVVDAQIKGVAELKGFSVIAFQLLEIKCILPMSKYSRTAFVRYNGQQNNLLTPEKSASNVR